MEKRRRARINHCLNELKSLILEAMKKDVSSRNPFPYKTLSPLDNSACRISTARENSLELDLRRIEF